MPIERIHSDVATRGAAIEEIQVHSVRLPGYVIAFEVVFGLPDERLTIRHDAGARAEPHIGGTVLTAHKGLQATGLDRLLFEE